MKRYLNWLGLLVMLSSPAFAQNRNSSTSAPVKTYNWMIPDMKSAQNPMYSNSFARQRIQHAFDQALNQKGLIRNTDHPDILLQFHTYTQRIRKNYNGGGYPMYGYPMYGFGRYGWGMPFGGYGGYYGGYPSSTTNTNGTLILDVTNPKTGEIVWQRAITGDVSNLNRLEKQIGKGVKKMMKTFPPNPS